MAPSEASQTGFRSIAKNFSSVEGYIRFIKLDAGVQGTDIDNFMHARRVHRERFGGLFIIVGLESRIHLQAAPQISDLVQVSL